MELCLAQWLVEDYPTSAAGICSSAYVYMFDETMPLEYECDFWRLEMEASMCSDFIIPGRTKACAYTILIHSSDFATPSSRRLVSLHMQSSMYVAF